MADSNDLREANRKQTSLYQYDPLRLTPRREKPKHKSQAAYIMDRGIAYANDALKAKLEELDKVPTASVLSAINYGKITDYETYMDLTQITRSLKKAGSNNMYGLNHMLYAPPVPENKDAYGYTFFTRPQLNMSTINLRRLRKFYNLLTTNPVSIQRFVRNTLDPRLGKTIEFPESNEAKQWKGKLQGIGNEDIKCPLVDPCMGFIPILTNNLISLEGWPDITMEYYTSPEGIKKEQWILADGRVDIYEAFSLSARFRNSRDEPIPLLIQTWIKYMSYVFEGLLSPYMDLLVGNEIDYNTRIYRLVTDETKRFVKKIGACGAAFPVNLSVGKYFDYSDETTYNTRNKDIDVQFQCVGAEYNDDITVSEFNYVSMIFNGGIRSMFATRIQPGADKKGGHEMVKIPHSLKPLLNNRGYPIIDEHTLELNWWINYKSQDFQKLMSYIQF